MTGMTGLTGAPDLQELREKAAKPLSNPSHGFSMSVFLIELDYGKIYREARSI